MPCEDAPCCGCCAPVTERDHNEAVESFLEQQEAEIYDADDADPVTGRGSLDADPGDMDGDFDTAMASAGFGTDEDYGFAEDMACEGYDEH